ncbi:hypothetical protein [Methylobacterium persicinum]|uniref:Tat pathway signal protein n=1 Tax=Methylobacterium persicinum TaxID=374426 RepID=A0ABU0HUE6_9HYPH|nr:hypothetical protein [Methylobacterium persicinum]MDQ0445453.1 hypothetical protein [Methylobacterium persicinum]GJE40816.1 hypothetical protein KHHGKMAE_4915 [Methylobacterium persicinum]
MNDRESSDLSTNRRDLIAASLIGAMPIGLGALFSSPAAASPLNPEQTIIRSPDQLEWIPTKGYPAHCSDRCSLSGDINGTGLYFTLIRWWPGYMSAPHTYTSDRLCMVLSGTWWCNSGPDFDPASCVPVKAGSYVRRVAGTSHYDGVMRGGTEPAVIAICGMAPVNYKLVDPTQPGWRRV